MPAYFHACLAFALAVARSPLLMTHRKIIDFLSAEGHIYSTIDDEHYRTTDM